MKRLFAASVLWMAAASGAAQQADEVGYPRNYAGFKQVRTTTVQREPSHGTVFINAPAASTDQVPWAYGSVIVMEWRRGGATGEVARLDVMRKERGFGESFGNDRTGDWAYASYAPDGKLLTGPAEALACAKCHAKAGAAKDFVYAAR
jgi:hypothetical protein